MKSLAIFTFLFCFLTFALLAPLGLLGCSSDTPVTNNPNPPSDPVIDTITLLTKDSIWFNETTPQQFASVSYLSTVQVDTIHLECSYHIYGIRSRFSYKVDGDTLFKYQRNITSNTQFDTTFNMIFTLNKINFISLVSIHPASSFFNSNEFASLKNIKLWYIRRS